MLPSSGETVPNGLDMSGINRNVIPRGYGVGWTMPQDSATPGNFCKALQSVMDTHTYSKAWEKTVQH